MSIREALPTRSWIQRIKVGSSADLKINHATLIMGSDGDYANDGLSDHAVCHRRVSASVRYGALPPAADGWTCGGKVEFRWG
jgi:hypothetical protein